MTTLYGPALRGGSEARILNREVRTAGDQQVHSSNVSIHGGPMERSPSENALRVDTRAVPQEVFDDVGMPVAGRAIQGVGEYVAQNVR